MKKKLNILVLASAFAMVGLTACGPQTQSSSSADVCAVTDDVKSIAEKAWNGVATTYADWSSTGVTGDQDLTMSAKKNSEDGTTTYNFNITYSVDSTYAASLKLSSDGKKIEVTCQDSLSGGKDVQTKVKVKLTLEGCTATAYETEFNVLVKAVVKVKSLADLYKTDSKGNALVANKSAVSFNAYYIGMYPGQGAIFGDGDYAILAYKTTELPEGTKEGDPFSISGVLSDYSGLRELSSSGTTITKLDTAPEGLTKPTTITLTNDDARAFKFGDDNRPVDVKGATVVSVSGDGSSSNLTVNVEVGGQTFAVFMNKDYSEDVIPTWKQTRDGQKNAELVKPGDTVSFTGYISAYSNVYQVVYGKVYEWSEAECAITAPSQLIKGTTDKISAKLKGGNLPTDMTFVSSDENIVKVELGEKKTDSKTGKVTSYYLKATGVGVGDATITLTCKGTVDGKEITHVETISINVFEVTPEETTVSDLIAKASTETTDGVWDTKTIYRVTGILEGKSATDANGYGYLTDATAGKSIRIYGLSGNLYNGFSMADGKYKYTNPKDAKDSLKDVNNGEKVTLVVMFEDYKGTPEIFGSVEKHETVTDTYASTLTVGEHGKAVSSQNKDQKLAYGTKVTITPTADDGYVAQATLTNNIGSTRLVPDADGKFTYEVTCKNEISVTFKEKTVLPASGTKVENDKWDCVNNTTSFPTSSSTTASYFYAEFATAKEILMGAVSSYVNTFNAANTLLLGKNAGFIYNIEAMPGKISSIKVTTATGAAKAAQYAVTFGTSALTSINKTNKQAIAPGESYEFTCSDDAKYFQISSANSSNGQLASVEITYTVD